MRLKDGIFHPFNTFFMAVYLDVILIFTNTWEEHLQHIQQDLNALHQQKLYDNF